MGIILLVALFYICWKVRKIDRKLNGSKGMIYNFADKLVSRSSEAEDVKTE